MVQGFKGPWFPTLNIERGTGNLVLNRKITIQDYPKAMNSFSK